MDEELNAVETEEEQELVSDEEEAVAEPSEDESDFSDTEGEREEEPAEPSEPEKPKQPRSRDSEYARIRRERERREAEQRAYERGKMEGLIGYRNKFTEEIMNDIHDVREYYQMLEADRRGLDPLEDFRKIQKEQAREQEKKSEEMESSHEKSEREVKEFLEKHPDASLEELFSDKKFLDYADGKIGVHPINEIYEKYIAFMGNYEAKAQRKAQEMLAKSLASPGPLSGDGSSQPVSYATMSKEAFEQEIERAKRGELLKK